MDDFDPFAVLQELKDSDTKLDIIKYNNLLDVCAKKQLFVAGRDLF